MALLYHNWDVLCQPIAGQDQLISALNGECILLTGQVEISTKNELMAYLKSYGFTHIEKDLKSNAENASQKRDEYRIVK